MPIKIGGVTSRSLDSYEGLYDLAYDSGLKDQADVILARHSGEDYKTVFSGGTISDIFDLLSLDSYGVVGLLKGKSFAEGVENRESFADNDAFGQFGLMGGLMGIAADIVVSPTTYVPGGVIAKVLGKIPGITEIAMKSKKALVGSMETREFSNGIQLEERVGGIKALTHIGDKIIYQNSVDPRYAEIQNMFTADLGIATSKTERLINPLRTLDKEVGEAMIQRDEFDNWMRKSDTQIKNELGDEMWQKVGPAYNRIDELSKEMLEEGMITKETYEKGIGNYIKNAYLEYEKADKKNGFFKGGQFGVKQQKSRKNLDIETREKLGEIKNPAYLVAATILRMEKDLAGARFQKRVRELFASDEVFEGAVQIPKTSKWEANKAKVVGKYEQIKKVNEEIKPLLKQMAKEFKGDRKMSSLIRRLEREIEGYRVKGTKELDKLFKLSNEVDELPGTAKRIDEMDDTIILKSAAKARREVITTELQQMKKQARDFRTGYKQGAKATKEQIKEVQTAFTKIVKDNFEGKDLARVISKIKNVTSPAKLEKAIDEVLALSGDLRAKAKVREAKDIYNDIVKLSKVAKKVIDKADAAKINKKSGLSRLAKLEEKINNLRFAKEDLFDEVAVDKFAQLSGKYVPEKIAEFLTEVETFEKAGLGGAIMAEFKFQKIIMSPAAHIRGIIGNMILNYWKLGINPLRIDRYFSAAMELKKGSPMVERARKMGLGASTMASQELKQMLDDPAMLGLSERFGSRYGRFKNFMGGIYDFEEQTAKFVAFKQNVAKGMTDLDAWLLAEEATYNYAQVTPFVRKMRTSLFGVPFLTFAIKSFPTAIETAVNNPQRIAIFGRLRNMLAEQGVNMGSEEEYESMPDWMKNGFYLRLPFNDQHDRPMYFDMTYTMPFSQFTTLLADIGAAATGGKPAGDVGTGAAAMGISSIPALQIWKELSSNQNFLGQQIFKTSDPIDQKVSDITMYLLKTMAPPPISANISAGYDPKTQEKAPVGIMRSLQMGEDPRQIETLLQELASYGAMKVRPYDVEVQETTNEYLKKQELQRLLVENGVLKEFNRAYVPK